MSFSNYNTTPANNPLNRAIANPISIEYQPRDPNSQDNTFPIGQEWQNTTTKDIWKCLSTGVSGAVWQIIAYDIGGNVISLSDSSSVKTFPDSNGNIAFPAGNGVSSSSGTSQLTLNMTSPFTGDFTFTSSTSGDTEVLTISNSSNTASSQAAEVISVAGTSAGDAFQSFIVGSAQSYALGIDNSDSQSFKIRSAANANASPSTGTTFMQITTAGTLIFPNAEGSVANNGVIIGTLTTIQPENFLKIGDVETGSTAVLDVTTVGSASLGLTSTTGDAVVNINAFGVQGYQMSARRSDAQLVVSNGTNDVFTISSLGAVRMPKTPAFLATHTVAQNNVTGNGTVVTVNFTSEIFDQSTSYDSTNTFTAPVTGIYLFNVSVQYSNLAATATSGNISLVTTARTYVSPSYAFGSIKDVSNNAVVGLSVIANMAAGDTCKVQTAVNGVGADTVNIPANTLTETFFSGTLLC